MADPPRVAFVTGASRGIGRAIARALGDAGYAVACAARTEADLDATAAAVESAGSPALAVRCDVTDEASVEAAIETTVAKLGGIDVVVNNAGITWLESTRTAPLKRWDLVLRVDLTGPFLVTRAAIPHLVERGGGALLAITTTGVGMTELGSNPYWVAKAGLERLYAGLAAELRGDDISVNCLAPAGVVLTEGAAAAGITVPAELVEDVEVIAGAAVRLAATRPSTGGPTGVVLLSTEV